MAGLKKLAQWFNILRQEFVKSLLVNKIYYDHNPAVNHGFIECGTKINYIV